jgi:TrpR-related protein YerC/YecD
MARFSLNKLPKEERIRLIGEFYDAMSTIKNRDEAAKVFKDILDGDEIGNVMRRIDVAILILLGFTYEEIVALLGVGKDKVRRVQQKLDRGGEGYRILIERILEKRKKRKVQLIKRRKKQQRWGSNPGIEFMKKKYGGSYFLIWNILDEFGDRLDAQSEIKDTKAEAKQYYGKKKSKKAK